MVCCEPSRFIDMFFYDIVNSEWYLKGILDPFFEELTEEKRVMHIFSRIVHQHTL
jgi:hypothetical protein